MQITKKKDQKVKVKYYTTSKSLYWLHVGTFFLFMSGRAPRLNYHTCHCTVSIETSLFLKSICW